MAYGEQEKGEGEGEGTWVARLLTIAKFRMDDGAQVLLRLFRKQALCLAAYPVRAKFVQYIITASDSAVSDLV